MYVQSNITVYLTLVCNQVRRGIIKKRWHDMMGDERKLMQKRIRLDVVRKDLGLTEIR